MSLAGPSRKNKISRDPNNIHWTSNTNAFGHKVLASQGWLPGQALGRANASHSKHFTQASTSHIRIALREENLGLGAKIGSGQGAGECTGLDNFQDLLGRLNGKTEAVIKKERRGREDIKRVLYADRRYGGWGKFVSAGHLVGDIIVEGQLDPISTLDAGESVTIPEGLHSAVTTDMSRPSASTEKIRQKIPMVAETGDDGDLMLFDALHSAKKSTHGEAKAEKRAEKVKRRLDRAERKAVRAAQKVKKEIISSSEQTPTPEDLITIAQPKAARIGSTNPTFAGGRHALRRKYIMQKKAATMDIKALNEILMVKG